MSILANAKHEAVAQAFIADREKIGWKAYKAIYPNSSQHACETAFSRLLKSAEFKARLDVLMGAAAADAVMSAREVLQELTKLGRSNMLDYMRVIGGEAVLDLSAVTRDQAGCLQEVTVEDFTDGRGDDAREVKRIKFKLYDKRAALNDLGRHHKLFGNALELEGGNIVVEIRKFADDRRSKAKPAKSAKHAKRAA